MFNGDFYTMCDELHSSLVSYYGGETKLMLAHMETNWNDFNTAISDTLNRPLEALHDSLRSFLDDEK